MIKEAIELIQQTAIKSAGVGQTVDINDQRWIVTPEGTQKVDLDPAKRDHRVHSLDAFIDACERYGELGTVWHSLTQVVLVINDAKRDENVTLPLQCSPQWSAFVSLDKQTETFAPANARLLLLRTLAGCVTDGMPARFGKVNFSRKSDGRADIDHGKESLGRAVESQVSATDDIPETINCAIPVYTTQGIKDAVAVSLAVDVRFDLEGFQIKPVAGDVEAGVNQIQAKLSEQLEATGLPVFFGSP